MNYTHNRKILCWLDPFGENQLAYVYEDGNKLESVTFKNGTQVSEILDKLITDYSITNIQLKGPKQYTKGIWNQFEDYLHTKYTNFDKKLTVEYI